MKKILFTFFLFLSIECLMFMENYNRLINEKNMFFIKIGYLINLRKSKTISIFVIKQKRIE